MVKLYIVVVYGILNCDIVKKVCVWFDDYGVEFEFYDFKKFGVSVLLIEDWLKDVLFDVFVNKCGIMWCGLDDVMKVVVEMKIGVVVLMIYKLLVIKCFVFVVNGCVKLFGFVVD